MGQPVTQQVTGSTGGTNYNQNKSGIVQTAPATTYTVPSQSFNALLGTFQQPPQQGQTQQQQGQQVQQTQQSQSMSGYHQNGTLGSQVQQVQQVPQVQSAQQVTMIPAQIHGAQGLQPMNQMLTQMGPIQQVAGVTTHATQMVGPTGIAANVNVGHSHGHGGGGHSQQAKSKNEYDECNLYVKGLWKECNQIDLDDLFKKYGVINQSRVYGDGVGFVRFDDPKCAQAVSYFSFFIFHL